MDPNPYESPQHADLRTWFRRKASPLVLIVGLAIGGFLTGGFCGGLYGFHYFSVPEEVNVRHQNAIIANSRAAIVACVLFGAVAGAIAGGSVAPLLRVIRK